MRRLSSVVAAFVLAVPAAQAQPASAPVKAAAAYKAPRTAFGQPDLQGLWMNSTATMLQRPPNLKSPVLSEAEAAAYEANFHRMILSTISTQGPIDITSPPPVVKQAPEVEWSWEELKLARVGGEIRSSLIVDPPSGLLPLTEEARKSVRQAALGAMTAFDGAEARPLEERCLSFTMRPEGPPMVGVIVNAPFQVLQTPDDVVILVEMTHDARIIRLKDKGRPPAGVGRWMGDSVGRWEGETLVIETTNFRAETGLPTMAGVYRFSPQAKVTERLTRTAKDSILYEFTVEDPTLFTRAWHGEMPWRPAKGPIFEVACHEGNYSLPNILGGAREEERAAAAAASSAPVAAVATAAK